MLKEKFNKETDKPYNKVLACNKKDLRISGDAYRLWETLYYSADDYNPTEASLAKQFNVNIRTIKRLIYELRHFGYMTIQGSKIGGYTWTIYKKSKGVFDVKANKFISKRTKEIQKNIKLKKRLLNKVLIHKN
jgi:DNA-binding transcriptional regulator YhcF (GntR family)